MSITSGNCTPVSAEQYMEHFRLRPEKTEELAHHFATSEYYNWQGDAPKVSALKCINVFLWFASNEAACFRNVSDRFKITKSTLFKTIRRVTVFLSNLSQEVITWSTDAVHLSSGCWDISEILLTLVKWLLTYKSTSIE
ncbi:hypothetical protein WA026_011203 [Henosepilachna vigintioctopunctata]|uniref:Transposase Helix-turn-helix domain-containing protein n=1 Tax=Henosepilachna vigintioctopunctata TaxID=420089 RepID=A0AAW1U7I3_9CUCU